jgi:hypothetical protein
MSEENRLISNNELIYTNMLQIEAIMRVLVKKGITTEEEVMNEIIKLKIEMDEKIRKGSLEN